MSENEQNEEAVENVPCGTGVEDVGTARKKGVLGLHLRPTFKDGEKFRKMVGALHLQAVADGRSDSKQAIRYLEKMVWEEQARREV